MYAELNNNFTPIIKIFLAEIKLYQLYYFYKSLLRCKVCLHLIESCTLYIVLNIYLYFTLPICFLLYRSSPSNMAMFLNIKLALNRPKILLRSRIHHLKIILWLILNEKLIIVK